MLSFFISDLHGNIKNYLKFFERIKSNKPKMVFIGGDLSGNLSRYPKTTIQNFYEDFLAPQFLKNLMNILKSEYPYIFIIMGNDDPQSEEVYLKNGETKGLWHYCHNKNTEVSDLNIVGYSFCPPTPFLLKDWEKYDVSRYVDPGCVSPEEGIRTIDIAENLKKYSTIKEDLKNFRSKIGLEKSIFLFHSPPYKTNLDRAALDNKVIDHVKVDCHVGSIAIKKFIEEEQPLLTLHGHIHESAKLTGRWSDKIGNTYCFNAAHHGKELSLIQFDTDNLENAERLLL